jgi:lipoprotein-anchoring transpeptidase ErfK/SrfK
MIYNKKMKFQIKRTDFAKVSAAVLSVGMSLFAIGCETPSSPATTNTNLAVNNNTAVANANVAPVNTPVENKEIAARMPLTLPVLDAMFGADETFANELKMKVQLTDEQVDNLKRISREAVTNLNEDEASEDSRSTRAAMERAEGQIREMLGEQKMVQFFNFVRERWSGGETAMNADGSSVATPNSVPTDTRVVVNAPAYRMDIFQGGKLVKSYKIGIGYPEFPLPSGVRKADTIIFNPTWTPPDEPWVKGKVEAGKTVAAGDKLNPLGPIKIPIGLPSLIHGGKQPARLGGFASHGCVGLTNPQVQDFALELAKISGLDLTAEDVKNYEKQKTETKNVKLNQAIPVELRYETIVVEDGKLKIYLDVYERGTNTEENLQKVLQAHGAAMDSLAAPEREKILAGLKQMAVDATGNAVEAGGSSNDNSANSNMSSANSKNNSNSKDASVTRNIKGKKEISFDIAALKGKGYPAAVGMKQ